MTETTPTTAADPKPASQGYAKLISQFVGVVLSVAVAAFTAAKGADSLTATLIWINVVIQTASAVSVYVVPNLTDAKYLKAIVAGVLLLCQAATLIAHVLIAGELPTEQLTQFIAGLLALIGTVQLSNGEITGSYKAPDMSATEALMLKYGITGQTPGKPDHAAE
jgi:uncharacterized membrane protein